MSIFKRIGGLLQDQPPYWIFEVSGAGIAWTRNDGAGSVQFQPLEEDVLSISPLHDNVQRPEALAGYVQKISGNGELKKGKRAALLLPDFCGRITVLDFDNFPADPKEQLSLVRFRMKKSVPFDIESALVSFHAQPVAAGESQSKREIIAGIAAHEIVARYEAPFRNAGFQPGFVTFSSLAALNLIPPSGSTVLARMAGRILTVAMTFGKAVRLVRCVELPENSGAEVASVLYPTFAYLEDEVGSRPGALLVCGMDAIVRDYGDQWAHDLHVPVSILDSPFGRPSAVNAGLLGYLAGEGA